MQITRSTLEHEGFSAEKIEKIMNFVYYGKTVKEWDQLVMDIEGLDEDGTPSRFYYQAKLKAAIVLAKLTLTNDN